MILKASWKSCNKLFKLSSESQGNLLTMSSCKIVKIKLIYFQYTMTQNKHSQEESLRSIPRKDWTKVKLQPNSANIKPCSYVASGAMVALAGLHFCVLPVSLILLPVSLSLVPPSIYSFPQQISHIWDSPKPGIFTPTSGSCL